MKVYCHLRSTHLHHKLNHWGKLNIDSQQRNRAKRETPTWKFKIGMEQNNKLGK